MTHGRLGHSLDFDGNKTQYWGKSRRRRSRVGACPGVEPHAVQEILDQEA